MYVYLLPVCRLCLPLGLCNLLIRAGYGLALHGAECDEGKNRRLLLSPAAPAALRLQQLLLHHHHHHRCHHHHIREFLSIYHQCVCCAQWEMLQTHKDGDRMGCGPRTTVIRVDDGNQQVNSPSEHLPSQPIHIPELDLPLQVWEPGPGQAPHPAQLTP